MWLAKEWGSDCRDHEEGQAALKCEAEEGVYMKKVLTPGRAMVKKAVEL